MRRSNLGDRLKKCSWGEEDKSITPVDGEALDRIKRYKSNIKEPVYSNYIKDLSYAHILWETMGSVVVNTMNGVNPVSSLTEFASFMRESLTILKEATINGFTVVDSRIVFVDIDVDNESMEHTRTTTIVSYNEANLNNYLAHTIERTEETDKLLAELLEINNEFYDLLASIRRTIISSLTLVD